MTPIQASIAALAVLGISLHIWFMRSLQLQCPDERAYKNIQVFQEDPSRSGNVDFVLTAISIRVETLERRAGDQERSLGPSRARPYRPVAHVPQRAGSAHWGL